jgi:hypothetical protein
VAVKVAAYNLGIMLNRGLGRPDFAFATLILYSSYKLIVYHVIIDLIFNFEYKILAHM